MKTRDLLCMTIQEYQDMVFSMFFNWVSKEQCSDEILQLRLIDNKIQNYFKEQLNRIEIEFKRDLKGNNHLDKETKVTYYLMITSKVNKYYPKALFRDVKPIKKRTNNDKTANKK